MVGYKGIEKALMKENTKILIFGKPNAKKGRRMGVVLAKGETVSEARTNSEYVSQFIKVIDKDIN